MLLKLIYKETSPTITKIFFVQRENTCFSALPHEEVIPIRRSKLEIQHDNSTFTFLYYNDKDAALACEIIDNCLDLIKNGPIPPFPVEIDISHNRVRQYEWDKEKKETDKPEHVEKTEPAGKSYM